MESLKKILPYLVIVALAAILLQTCVDRRNEVARYKDNLRISRDSVKHFIDKNGQLVSQVQSMQLTASELKEQSEELGIDKKRLEKQVGNLNNLVLYYKGLAVSKGTGTTKAKDSIVTTIADNGDTVKRKAKTIKWNNGSLFLDETYFPDTDSMKIAYQYKTGIELTAFYRRDFIFIGKKNLFVEVKFTDPNASMVDAQAVKVDLPPKKWYERWWFYILAGVAAGKAFL